MGGPPNIFHTRGWGAFKISVEGFMLGIGPPKKYTMFVGNTHVSMRWGTFSKFRLAPLVHSRSKWMAMLCVGVSSFLI